MRGAFGWAMLRVNDRVVYGVNVLVVVRVYISTYKHIIYIYRCTHADISSVTEAENVFALWIR